MQDLIKEIRNRLGYSQEQLASILKVSPISISRWENGKAIPTELAQNQLFEICKKHNLDLADYKTKKEQLDKKGLILYHASRNGIKGSIKPISRVECDFGKGFYMGTNPIQPLTLICGQEYPIFYTLSFDIKKLKVLDIEIGLDWALLIAYYRGYMNEIKGSKLYEKYAHMADGNDVIVGYIADDRMYQALRDFFESRITDVTLMACLSALDLGRQYVAITKKACGQIDILKERKLSKLELMFLKEKSIARRKEGLSIVDNAIKQHRREGKYFDEILQGN